MKLSLNWVKKYTDINVSVRELCDKMTMAGFEVEGIEDASAAAQNVVVGRIEKIEKHPDSDHLLICQVNVGSGTVQIVTGASNVFQGALVPAALNDSILPNGTHIKSGKLRGVVSDGMLCSGEELMLSEEEYPGAGVYGILILKDDCTIGDNIMKAVGKDDCIIDFSITPNRPDCQCVLGMAREIAAVLGNEFRLPETQYHSVSQNINGIMQAEVQDGILCPRYMLMGVRNVKIAPSPKWLCDCLISAGLRPINNIVDITNFIMLETGHPMHAFDARDIKGGKIIVRRAQEGESITTLDGKPHTLTNEMLVISDSTRPVALAGIMGGENSEIKEDTTDVIFECAKFKRDNIRRTARALGIRTDASSLYEKGVDAGSVPYAIKRAVSLICELGAGEVLDGAADSAADAVYERSISVRTQDVNRLLGITVPDDEMLRIMLSLDIKSTLRDGVLNCTVPSRRDDLETAADIAEEIIRIYGYEHITPKPLKADLRIGTMQPSIANMNDMRNYLIKAGCSEICTYSFISKKADDMLMLSAQDERRNGITLLNPLGEDYSVLRTQMIHSMLTVLSLNQNRGVGHARLFETGVLHIAKETPIVNQPREIPHICIGIYGQGDFFTLKGIVQGIIGMYNGKAVCRASEENFLHPYRQAEFVAAGKTVALLGQVHPAVCENYALSGEVYVAQINIGELSGFGRRKIKFLPLPKFPSVQRDLAVVVDEKITAGELLECIEKAGGPLLRSAELFDVYRSDLLGSDKKSTAFSLEFRADDRTLTVEEVAKIFDKIVRSLEFRMGAKLR